MKYEKEYIGAPLNNITSNGDAIPNCRISFLNGGDYYKITNAVNTYLKRLNDELKANKGKLYYVNYMFTDKIIVLDIGVEPRRYADVINLEGESIWSDILQVLEKIPEEVALKYFYDNKGLNTYALSLSGLEYLYEITILSKNKLTWHHIPEKLKRYICKV